VTVREYLDLLIRLARRVCATDGGHVAVQALRQAMRDAGDEEVQP
jgi:hypothetical protein